MHELVKYWQVIGSHSTASTPWTNWVNRPLAAPLVHACLVLHVTPNAVTTASLAVALLGVAVLAMDPNALFNRFALVFLLQLSYALDVVDGTLARMLGQTSRFGQWYDLVVDRLVHVLCLGGIMIVCAPRHASHEVYLQYHAVLIVLIAVSLAHLTAVNLKTLLFPRDKEAARSSRWNLRPVATILVDYGFLLFAVSLGVAAGQLLAAALVMTCAHLAGLLLTIHNVYRVCHPLPTEKMATSPLAAMVSR